MLLWKLWQLFRVIWKKGAIPECWKEAEGCFVPKEKNSLTINQFGTISLLNVGVKMYMSALAKRISGHMVENSYIDTSTQKAGIPGVSGCIEHTSVISQLIKEVKKGKNFAAVC